MMTVKTSQQTVVLDVRDQVTIAMQTFNVISLVLVLVLVLGDGIAGAHVIKMGINQGLVPPIQVFTKSKNVEGVGEEDRGNKVM